MTLLNQGNEHVIVFPEETYTSDDGQELTRASTTGVPCRAAISPAGRPTEGRDDGYTGRTQYRLRLVGYPGELGAQSQIEWRGQRYSVDGKPMRFNRSPATAHTSYLIVRS